MMATKPVKPSFKIVRTLLQIGLNKKLQSAPNFRTVLAHSLNVARTTFNETLKAMTSRDRMLLSTTGTPACGYLQALTVQATKNTRTRPRPRKRKWRDMMAKASTERVEAALKKLLRFKCVVDFYNFQVIHSL
jgi:hypothetical protein